MRQNAAVREIEWVGEPELVVVRKRVRRLRVSKFMFASLVVYLLGMMAVGEFQVLQLKGHESKLRTQIHQVQQKNALLQKQITQLNDPNFIRRMARSELGLVSKGQIEYMVAPNSKVSG